MESYHKRNTYSGKSFTGQIFIVVILNKFFIVVNGQILNKFCTQIQIGLVHFQFLIVRT